MLSSSNYLSTQSNVMGNMGKFLPVMIAFKSAIQRAIIPMLSPTELSDIKDCRLNITVVEKLTNLGKTKYQHAAERNDETLYCLCMAIGTIIKEYDWGIKYVQQDGMCELAAKIAAI